MKQLLYIPLILLSFNFLFTGCAREAAEEEVNLPEDSEFSMNISLRPNNPMVTDSLEIILDGSTGNLFIMSLSAVEYEGGYDEFRLTAIGIALPGTKTINYSSSNGFVDYFHALSGKYYTTEALGGDGQIAVSFYDESTKIIRGSFNFTLVDTLTGESITIDNGQFDTVVDELN